ncbi:MAG: hypothetical protein GXP17_02840 [Gammaproteobacteria bacterium]|nr:hypothetical protein [Gammaproteobacteria bacterium]
MFSWFRLLASLKLTLVGMVLLGGGAALSYNNPVDVSVWVLVLPLSLLAVNLTAAIITNPRINRQIGLLVFHVCLLATVLLAGVGRMTHLDAHLEITNGQGFTPDLLLDVRKGPWHTGSLKKVAFVQGDFTVDYSAGLKRNLTHSMVYLPENGRMREQDVGDDRPLVLERYRFYTTHNKGFSPVLTWVPDQGATVTGRINMPSYPLFDYKQSNQWTPPGSRQEIKFWLQLNTGLSVGDAWVLDARNSSGVLVVTIDGLRVELEKGESVRLPDGQLRYDDLTSWMGYRVFYDPTLQWLFWVTIAGVLGLMHFFWKKLNLVPWMDEATSASVLPAEKLAGAPEKQGSKGQAV